jgi:hypothetical protein
MGWQQQGRRSEFVGEGRRRLTQVAAAAVMSLDQPKVSTLLIGRLSAKRMRKKSTKVLPSVLSANALSPPQAVYFMLIFTWPT